MLQRVANAVRSIACMLALASIAATAFAQIMSTGIHGVVRDQSGAVVPKASVTAVDTGTGIERNTITANDGGFVFPNLLAGTYRISASAAGFQTAVLDVVTVD